MIKKVFARSRIRERHEGIRVHNGRRHRQYQLQTAIVEALFRKNEIVSGNRTKQTAPTELLNNNLDIVSNTIIQVTDNGALLDKMSPSGIRSVVQVGLDELMRSAGNYEVNPRSLRKFHSVAVREMYDPLKNAVHVQLQPQETKPTRYKRVRNGNLSTVQQTSLNKSIQAKLVQVARQRARTEIMKRLREYMRTRSGQHEDTKAVTTKGNQEPLEIKQGMTGTTVALLRKGVRLDEVRQLPLGSVACLDPAEYQSVDEIVRVIEDINMYSMSAPKIDDNQSSYSPPLVVVLKPVAPSGMGISFNNAAVDRIQRAGAVYAVRPKGYDEVTDRRKKLGILTLEWNNILEQSAKVGIVSPPKQKVIHTQTLTAEQRLTREAKLNEFYGAPSFQLSDEEFETLLLDASSAKTRRSNQ